MGGFTLKKKNTIEGLTKHRDKKEERGHQGMCVDEVLDLEE
jgi:hypothetical protein